MMTRDEALQKAAKLLRLAESQNPHEAALAAARAQELLDKYELDRAAIELDGGAPEPPEEIVDFGRRGDALTAPDINPNVVGKTWPRRLALALARANGCFLYFTSGGKFEHGLNLVGRPSDVAKVRYLFQYLTGEVLRLSRRDCAGSSGSWTRNYQLGVVDEIATQLRRAREAAQDAFRREAAGETRALVKVDQAIAVVSQRRDDAEAFANELHNFKTARSTVMSFQPGARAAGRAAGREIKLGGARGALSGGTPGLPGRRS